MSEDGTPCFFTPSVEKKPHKTWLQATVLINTMIQNTKTLPLNYPPFIFENFMALKKRAEEKPGRGNGIK